MRGWMWVAVVVIAASLVLALIPHKTDHLVPDWLDALPILFIGLLAPLSLLGMLPERARARVPRPAHSAPSFQRPPPSQTI